MPARTRDAGDEYAMPKISQEFWSRLSRYPGDRRCRVIVLLQDPSHAAPQEATHSEREVVAMKPGAQQESLARLDEVLTAFGGRRLTSTPNRLGYVKLETTCQGIKALAESSFVRSILEDQAIHRLAVPSGVR